MAPKSKIKIVSHLFPQEIASKLPIQNEDPYLAIEPLHDFDWKSTEPLKIRPFKPKYHLTMGTPMKKCSLHIHVTAFI